MSADSKGPIQASVKCPICAENYNKSTNSPLVLQCGHTVCKQCVRALFNQERQVICPVDRKKDSRSLESIPPSLQILELVEYITKMQDEIEYLKLSPEEKEQRRKRRFAERKLAFEDAIGRARSHVEEINQNRDAVLQTMRGHFQEMAQALGTRQQELETQIQVATEKHLEGYVALRTQAQARLESVQGLIEEIDGTNPIAVDAIDIPRVRDLEEDVPTQEFHLSFICKEDEVLSLIKEVGKVAKVHQIQVPYECDNFTNVTYWMIPPCCYQYYCCNKCHDKKEKHSWQYANRMVCMYCDYDQSYRKLPNVCENCGVQHKGVSSKH